MRLLIALVAMLPLIASAENVIYGDSGTGPQPVKVNSSGQISTTLLAGEDQTNGVMKVEQQFSYCVKAADGACGAAGTRFIHTMTCSGNDGTAEAGSVQLRDSASAGAGTVLATITIAAAALNPINVALDVIVTAGAYVDFTTTTDVTCLVSYR